MLSKWWLASGWENIQSLKQLTHITHKWGIKTVKTFLRSQSMSIELLTAGHTQILSAYPSHIS